jgi:multidrug efflux system membrane fusion protein
MRSTNLRGVLVSLAFATLLAILALSGCSEEAPSSFERPPAPVSISAAISRDVPVYIDAVGKIAAREVVSIQPQVSGRLTKIHFADGADVNAGDVLFTIDSRPFQAQLNQEEANLAEARAALSLAKINLARVESVSDPRAVSRQDYDARKNAVEVAEAQLGQARAAVETARLNLEYCTIRAPITGRAGQRLADAGNVVSANDTTLLVIQRLDPIYADFTIPENELSDVQRNMTRRTLRVEVRLPDEPDEPREGRLTFVDNSVQDGTGTIKLRASLDNRDRRFWPGRFARVRLILDTQRQAVLVPAGAPQTSAKGPFLYVIRPDSTAELRPVTTGQRQGDMIVIEKGVKAGERVVTGGQLGVTPDGKVQITSPGNATTPSSEAASPGAS